MGLWAQGPWAPGFKYEGSCARGTLASNTRDKGPMGPRLEIRGALGPWALGLVWIRGPWDLCMVVPSTLSMGVLWSYLSVGVYIFCPVVQAESAALANSLTPSNPHL